MALKINAALGPWALASARGPNALHCAFLKAIKKRDRSRVFYGRLARITAPWLWPEGLLETWPIFAAAVAGQLGA